MDEPSTSWELGRLTRYYNGTLKRTRESLGLTPAEVAKKVGVGYQTYLNYEKMKQIPKPETAKLIAKALKTTTETLFPKFLELLKEGAKTRMEYGRIDTISIEEVKHLQLTDGTPSTGKRLEAEIIKETLKKELENLKPREREIVEMRFGLKDGHPHTLEEVGDEYCVTREKIRQIEAYAMGKLRRSKKVQKLKYALVDDEILESI